MEAKYLKYVYYSISLVSLVVILLSGKYFLGGYDKIVIQEGGEIDLALAIMVKSTTTNGSDPKNFQETTIKGKLTGDKIILLEWDETGEMVKYEGIVLSGKIVSIPAGMEVKTLKFSNHVHTNLTMHQLVRPKEAVIFDKMKKFAWKNSMVVHPQMIIFSPEEKSNRYIVPISD